MSASIGDLFGEQIVPHTAAEWDSLDYRAADIFSPHAPIDEQQLFAGRSALMEGLMETVFQRGQHAILYGDRGVGKTSLANIVKDKVFARSARYRFFKRNCTASHNFMKIWRQLFDDTRVDEDGTTLDEYVDHMTDAYGVFKCIDRFPASSHPVFIIDEYDRIQDDKTHEKMADTIKYFSDYSCRATIIIIGVARDVKGLFGGHPSIERAVRQLPMPAMRHEELLQIFETRLPDLGMTIDDFVLNTLIRLAQGLPGYTHLLGQLAARNAIARRSLRIEMVDLNDAIHRAIDSCDEKIKGLYASAVRSARPTNQYREVLLACALAPVDQRGYFTAADVRDAFLQVMKRPMEVQNFTRHITEFCSSDRGPALLREGRPKSYEFRFSDALLRPFIVIKGINEGLISQVNLAQAP